MRFFASGFFHESVSPQPQSILLGSFRIFSKIRGDIRKSRCTTGINDTGGKQWEQYQAADTLKWTWRQKFIFMVTLLSKGVPTKLFKFFWLKNFFHLPPVVNLELWIFPRIFKKFKTTLMKLGGNWFMKKPEVEKISWHCPFKSSIRSLLYRKGWGWVALPPPHNPISQLICGYFILCTEAHFMYRTVSSWFLKSFAMGGEWP